MHDRSELVHPSHKTTQEVKGVFCSEFDRVSISLDLSARVIFSNRSLTFSSVRRKSHLKWAFCLSVCRRPLERLHLWRRPSKFEAKHSKNKTMNYSTPYSKRYELEVMFSWPRLDQNCTRIPDPDPRVCAFNISSRVGPTPSSLKKKKNTHSFPDSSETSEHGIEHQLHPEDGQVKDESGKDRIVEGHPHLWSWHGKLEILAVLFPLSAGCLSFYLSHLCSGLENRYSTLWSELTKVNWWVQQTRCTWCVLARTFGARNNCSPGWDTSVFSLLLHFFEFCTFHSHDATVADAVSLQKNICLWTNKHCMVGTNKISIFILVLTLLTFHKYIVFLPHSKSHSLCPSPCTYSNVSSNVRLLTTRKDKDK